MLLWAVLSALAISFSIAGLVLSERAYSGWLTAVGLLLTVAGAVVMFNIVIGEVVAQ